MKIIFFNTPEAVKDTESIKIKLYKKMDTIGYTFENLIMSSEKQITADYFTSGFISTGSFASSLPFIQYSPTHTIQFKLVNSLPRATADFGNRILVVMPSQMTKDASRTAEVRSLDDFLESIAIIRIEDDA